MGRPFIDTTGQQFGYVTVIEDRRGQGENPRVKVRCVCGKEFYKYKALLKTRQRPSCGCQSDWYAKTILRKHGMTHSKLMHSYRNHKHRGTLDKRWHDFSTMYRDIGEDVNVSRIDLNRPLGPDNYIARPNGGVLVTIDGETKNLREWGVVLGVTRERARQLYRKGKLRDRVRQCNQNRQ